MNEYGSLNRAARILLVEDNPDDVNLTKLAFQKVALDSSIHVARDGKEAIAFLRREGEFTDSPTPDLVLLDLNMPIKDGHAVLKEMKQDSMLRRIPVVVLTTSSASTDVVLSYSEHANAYLVKPMEIDGWFEMVKGISLFWLKLARLPPTPGTAQCARA